MLTYMSKKAPLSLKSLLVACLLMPANPTLGIVLYKDFLQYDPNPCLFINQAPAEDIRFKDVSTGKEVRIKIEGRHDNPPTKGCLAACYGPQQKGMFLLGAKELNYFDGYEQKGDDIILPNAPQHIFRIKKQAVCYTPIFSKNRQQAVIYHQFEQQKHSNISEDEAIFCQGFLHIYRGKTPDAVYKVSMIEERDDTLRHLFVSEIEFGKKSVVYAALTNSGQLASISGTQENRNLVLGCRSFQGGQDVRAKAASQPDYCMPKALAERLVHLRYDEKSEKFEFWTVKREAHERHVSFGEVEKYEATFGSLEKGRLPDPARENPVATMPLDIASVDKNIDHLVYLTRTRQGFFSDHYQLTYIDKRGETKVGHLTKNHLPTQIGTGLVVVAAIGISYMRHSSYV